MVNSFFHLWKSIALQYQTRGKEGWHKSNQEMVLSWRREGLVWIPGGSSLLAESGEVLAQAAQRGCRCPVPGGVQGQVGWGPGEVNGEVGGPAWGRRGWRFMILEVPSNPGHSVILWFTCSCVCLKWTENILSIPQQVLKHIFVSKVSIQHPHINYTLRGQLKHSTRIWVS